MRIVSREEWGAQYGTGPRVSASYLPWNEAAIHTEAGAVLPGDLDGLGPLADLLQGNERLHMLSIERYHVKTRGWQAIGYSFVIFRDGTICEGRGWGRVGAHTQQGRNSTAVGICFAGHGDYQEASGAQWAAARWLIGEGIRLGHLRPDPKVSGHRDYTNKSCPGSKNYPHLHRLRGIMGPIVPDIDINPDPTDEDIDMTEDELSKMLDKKLLPLALILLQLQQELLLPLSDPDPATPDGPRATRHDRLVGLTKETRDIVRDLRDGAKMTTTITTEATPS